ncbi:PREDICTED: ribonuclease-like storage protein [Ipomoea nil]|uniref:ribonuclease-like storage protein n=1 Tax=Ipomoea nil TaxID=35883 RepID=UPI0009017514|nr:PREDICTED: ribonuclease-like storage protein [Ipomoea nil]
MKIFAILFIFLGCIQKSYEQPWVKFYLVLYWPPGHCYTSQNCLYHRVIENFTIHGLWPINMIDQSPSIPPNGTKYNHSLMHDHLKIELFTMWRNYEANKFVEACWADEWNNHGIISESLLNQIKYFKTVKEMYSSLHIHDILTQSNIFPSPRLQNSIPFFMALVKRLKVKPLLKCKESYLTEVRFCYDQAAETLVDCNQIDYNCPEYFIFKNA